MFSSYILRMLNDWKTSLDTGDDVDIIHWNAGLWDDLVLYDGVNWYAYCSGDPVNFVDPSGYDAIVLTNEAGVNSGDYLSESLKGTIINDIVNNINWGHQGILVQDENNDWFYFSCGINYVEYTKIKSPENEMTDLKTFSDEYYNKGQGNYVYTTSTYISGDFSESAKYFKEYKRLNEGDGNASSYNALTNNCTTVMTQGLYRGKLNDGTTVGRYMDFKAGTIPNMFKNTIANKFFNKSFTYEDFEKTLTDELKEAKRFSLFNLGKINNIERLLPKEEE